MDGISGQGGEIDVQIKDMHRARWVTLAAVITLLVCAVGVLGFSAVVLESELQASCDLYRGVAILPVEPAQGQKHPSRLGVSLVVGGRTAYLGEHCGSLPAAPASTVRWARYYHIPMP